MKYFVIIIGLTFFLSGGWAVSSGRILFGGMVYRETDRQNFYAGVLAYLSGGIFLVFCGSYL
jgi:hypothetical protein